MRLIDADNVLKSIEELKQSPWCNGTVFEDGYLVNFDVIIRKEAIDYVRDVCVKSEHTIGAVKHGHWILKHRYDDEEYSEGEYDSFECSVCGNEVDFEESWSFSDYMTIYKANYCNCCGAKMDEDH